MSRLRLVRAGVAALVAAAVAADSLWPTPASVEMQTGDCVVIPPTATMEATGYTSDVLTDAMKRYTAIIFGRRSPSWAPSYAGCKPIPFRVIQVQVTSPNLTLGLETDESYQLTVQYTGFVNLVAPTAYGAVRGLETLSQLVDYDSPSGNFYATVGEIVDAPVFRHRGALLDTSRHFLPLSAILAFIDALSYNKVNVLHWHIVDDPSFPYVSAAYPALSAQGAYGAPNATVAAAHTYPPADVQAVINYARLRGIRTLAEFDTPGHSGSWGLGQPGLLTQCYNTTTGQPIPGSFGPIDPTNPANFGFLQGLLSEVATVFPDRYLHVGGDEVSFTCWASNPAINAWMAANGIPAGNYAALEGYYVQKVLDMVNTLPPAGTKAPMAWQEVFDNGLRLAPDTVVAVWKYHSTSAPAPEEAGGVTAAPTLTWQSEVYNVTAAGFRTVVSSPWYLNYIAYGVDWTQYLTADLLDFNGTAAQKALVMGGEFAVWGEYVDATNLQSRTWPRASAVAQALWANPGAKANLTDAAAKLQAHRCRLLVRGIEAEPPNGPAYCPQEWVPAYTPPWQTA